MNLDRIFRVINILLGTAALAVLLAGYWFFWRPLPDYSGRLEAPVEQEVTVTRDKLGVPSIQAANEGDLLFAQGYITAEERMWQMDGLRRFAAGELAEIIGPGGIEADTESRKLRMRHIAEQVYVELAPNDKAQFAAYSRGVNHYLETHRGKYSFEFAILGYDPRPWSVVDSILVGLYMYRNLTTSYPEKLVKRNLLRGGDAQKIGFLFPLRAGTEILPGGDVQPGSNAWVVSGAHTVSGKPLLSNDMHLEYSVPGIWYMTGLQAPGLHVAGVALPGIPGIIVGHNEQIAWGVTNLHFDVQELYAERFDSSTGRYAFRGQVEQAQLEQETIRVKGRPAVEFRHWITRHGPLVVDDATDHIALKWTAAQSGNFQFPFLEIDKAKNWGEFRTALTRFPGPGQNFVYADREGNIGYQATGKLPLRRNYQGDLPVDGASGNFEWDGYVPFDQLPSAFNPADGYIVTANQNPFRADSGFTVTGTFAPPYRSGQIRDMLGAKAKLAPQDTLAIQKDVYSAFLHLFARQLILAADRKKVTNPAFAEVLPLLRNWNGQMDKDLAAPFVATIAFQHFRRTVANVASPGNGSLYETKMSNAAIARLLRERPSGWFRDYEEALVKSLADAVDECQRMQGSAVNKWFYGKYLKLAINHPVGHQLPLVASYFDIGPVAMSGGSTTVKQTTPRLGPSERFNADLGDWDNSLLNLPVGQSGHVLSRHYKDEWNAYYAGTSFPMKFEHPDVRDTLVFTKK